MSEATEKNKVVAKIIKSAKVPKSKASEYIDKLSDQPEEYLKELLRAIENLKQ